MCVIIKICCFLTLNFAFLDLTVTRKPGQHVNNDLHTQNEMFV